MIKKRIVFLGVIIGLVLGGISILAGVFLPGEMWGINWLSNGSHSWGGFTAIYISFALIYWTLIGLLIGLSIRWLISRKDSHDA
jgi:hypothetical protein